MRINPQIFQLAVCTNNLTVCRGNQFYRPCFPKVSLLLYQLLNNSILVSCSFWSDANISYVGVGWFCHPRLKRPYVSGTETCFLNIFNYKNLISKPHVFILIFFISFDKKRRHKQSHKHPYIIALQVFVSRSKSKNVDTGRRSQVHDAIVHTQAFIFAEHIESRKVSGSVLLD